jgi:hypothetical protein
MQFGHAVELTQSFAHGSVAFACNDVSDVSSPRTIRFDATLDAAERARVDAALLSVGATARWSADDAIGRTYALIEVASPVDDSALRAAAAGATVYDVPIIALAVYPRPAEALSALEAALGGAGRPDGILACDRMGDAIVLELERRTSPQVVFAIADAELRRFNGQRLGRLLAPLPAAELARISAEGLQAPEIAPDRILDVLIEGMHGSL